MDRMIEVLEDMLKNITDNQHLKAREQLKQIHSRAELNALLDETLLTDDERNVIIEHYANGKSLSVIADFMGYSESTIKRYHKQALIKLYDAI
jgi:RNA polymerase sigma factor (sigma-70 family)